MASDDVLLARLAEKVAGLLGHQDQVDKQVGDLAEQLAEVAELLKPDPAFPVSPWWFPRMDRDQAKEAYETLIEWVDTVIIPIYDHQLSSTEEDLKLEKTPAGRTLERCWFAHDQVRDKLAALWWAWKGNYRKHAPADGPHTFQHVQIPVTLQQIGSNDVVHSMNCRKRCSALDGSCLAEKGAGELTRADRDNWLAEIYAKYPEPPTPD